MNTDILEMVYFGRPEHNDLPEPSYEEVPVNGVKVDRDGMPWTRDAHGWCAFGDARPQSWEQVKQWFSS